MNLALFIKQPLLKKYLLKQLAYFANGWYAFDHNEFKAIDSSKAKIVIVAKTHFQQTWQSYASVSKKELQQILALQKNNQDPSATIFQVFDNKTIDGFDVKKTHFDQALLAVVGNQKILIPETEIIAEQNKKQSILTLATPAGQLFVSVFSGKSTATYAKGLVKNLNTFILSSGLPLDVAQKSINQNEYAQFLFTEFVKQKLGNLYQIAAFDVKQWFKAQDLHLLYWAPLLTASCFYLLSNSFLWTQSYFIEQSLAEQGADVNQLLSQKRQQDKQSQLLNLLNQEFSKTDNVHNHWAIVYNLVETGMVIDRLTFSKKQLTIRGKSDNASKVLAEVAKHPFVSNAGFKGPVRKSRGQQNFVIELEPIKPIVLNNNELEQLAETEEHIKDKIAQSSENTANEKVK